MLAIPFQIQILNLSKSFHQQSIFKDLSFNLYPSHRLAVTGPNGSGKSTFLKVFVGKMQSDSGNVSLIKGKKSVSSDFFYKYIAWDAPYIEIYPYFSVKETFYWHFQFFTPILSLKEWLNVLQLEDFQNKELKYLSSGTLQRVKVGLALFSQTPILVLDEPTANMDTGNANKMIELIYTYSQNRILVIASNLLREVERTDQQLVCSFHSGSLVFHLYTKIG
ncbi:MAG: heme ABC exporter ATP-binding protein CcmA [Bacteroidia bacterium]|nr:MAG: heme ABC exporter ATP-binding protein CcmA [Bacteroidia bacterium]